MVTIEECLYSLFVEDYKHQTESEDLATYAETKSHSDHPFSDRLTSPIVYMILHVSSLLDLQPVFDTTC